MRIAEAKRKIIFYGNESIFLFEVLQVSSLLYVGDRSCCVAVSVAMVVEAGVNAWPGRELSGPTTNLYFKMPSRLVEEARAHSSLILHLGLGSLCQIVPSGSHLHGRFISICCRSSRSTQEGATPWSLGIISSQVRPLPGSVCASGASQSSESSFSLSFSRRSLSSISSSHSSMSATSRVMEEATPL